MDKYESDKFFKHGFYIMKKMAWIIDFLPEKGTY